MANPHRGEVEFKGNDGKQYTLSFSINTLCELDEALSIEDAVNNLIASGKATLKQYRTMFYMAVKAHHPDIADEKQAADLVSLGQMMKLLTRAILLANPEAEAGAQPDPPSKGGRAKATGLAS